MSGGAPGTMSTKTEGRDYFDSHPGVALAIEDRVLPPNAILDSGSTRELFLEDAPANPLARAFVGCVNETPILTLPNLQSNAPVSERAWPAQAAQALGLQALFLVGWGVPLGADTRPGQWMLVTDHINLLGETPLIGLQGVVPRFPDMSEPYNGPLLAAAEDSARTVGVDLARGVYLACPVHSLHQPETISRARSAEARCAGPCIVPQAIAAAACGVEVLGLVRLVECEDHVTQEHRPPIVSKELVNICRLIGNLIVRRMSDDRGKEGHV